MKESIDDRITKRIREVMQQYEPDYSPQAWEKLRKQMPVPVFWLKRVLLKYKYWFAGVGIVGVLLVAYKVTSLTASDNNSANDPITSESVNQIVSEKSKEVIYSKKVAALSISKDSNRREEENISLKGTTVLVTDPLQVAYQDYIQPENAIAEMPESIERNVIIPVFTEEISLGYQCDIAQLIPMRSQTEEISGTKSLSSERTSKSKFQWPELNSIFIKEESYDKFVGPNKLAVFYSPEFLRSNSLKSLGASHGIGISFEGPIRTSISLSAGVSYQSINFHKTISPIKVPESPDDTTYIESGNYKYLEVPVSINFKFFESSGSQVWLGTGISSIIFLKQDYSSETIIGGISDQSAFSAKGWENVLPLASLNLGLYYRFQLSGRLSLNSEVLYKYHLVRLGYNSMKLDRFNLQIGLVYRFGRED